MTDEKSTSADETVVVSDERSADAPEFVSPDEFPNYDDKDAGEVEVSERLERTYEAPADPEAEH